MTAALKTTGVDNTRTENKANVIMLRICNNILLNA